MKLIMIAARKMEIEEECHVFVEGLLNNVSVMSEASNFKN